MKRRVWIISEGSPGHVSQSVGLAEALAAREPLSVERFECRPQLNGPARRLVRVWMEWTGRSLPDWALRRWLRLDMTAVTVGRPDLILSSGGKSVFAARTLAARYAAPYVFVGERKPYPSDWFHTVFTPSAMETGLNDVAIEMIPTQVTRKRVEQAAGDWKERPQGRLWVALIGGSSASHHYTPRDWETLALAMNKLAASEGIRWLVTTSRRTGAEAETRLRENLNPEAVAEAVWWSLKPEKKMSAYLGAAEWVLATQDSVTMVSEAIDAGRLVVIARPRDTRFAAGSFLPAYFARLDETGRVRRRLIDELSACWPAKDELVPRSSTTAEEMAEVLRKRLHWM